MMDAQGFSAQGSSPCRTHDSSRAPDPLGRGAHDADTRPILSGLRDDAPALSSPDRERSRNAAGWQGTRARRRDAAAPSLGRPILFGPGEHRRWLTRPFADYEALYRRILGQLRAGAAERGEPILFPQWVNPDQLWAILPTPLPPHIRTLVSQEFTSSGTFTAFVGQVTVRLIGGGGGGGGGYLADAAGGGGGGAGSTQMAVVTTGAVTVTIGPGGAGGSISADDSTAGGSTTFGAHATASGGGRGIFGKTGTSGNGNGGAGGAAGSGGFAGGKGGTGSGTGPNSPGGPGGGAAGWSGPGSDATDASGATSGLPGSGNVPGGMGGVGLAGAAGSVGTPYGSGGGGGNRGATSGVGAAGRGGYCLLTWFQ